MSTSSQQQKKILKTHSRKLSLQKFLASTNIQQTKNNIRSIIDAHTNNYAINNNISSTMSSSLSTRVSNKQSTMTPYNINNNNNPFSINNIGQSASQYHSNSTHLFLNPIVQAIKSIKQPLSKLQRQSFLINNTLNKLKTQSINNHKLSHQSVHIQFNPINDNINQFANNIQNQHNLHNQCITNILLSQQKQSHSWKLWMGNVFKQIFQRSFHLYNSQVLQYDQMRSFCCQQLLLNLIRFEKQQSGVIKNTPCHQWELQTYKILQHQCNKYPQTQQIQINKKLQQTVNRNKINNFQSDDYDLIDKTQISFKYKSTNDYTQEIMTFLNHVITITQRIIVNNNTKSKNIGNKGLNLFTNFHIFFSNVFNLVFHRNINMDMNLLLNQQMNDYQYCKYKFSQQEEIQYKQKVKAYTKIQIGSKIPIHSPLYSYDQIVSGNIQMKSKPVARVIDKWIDQLRDKILYPEKSIDQRIHRFKGQNPGDRTKLTKKQKQILIQKIKDQKLNLIDFDKKLRSNIQYVSERLMTDLGNLTDLTFMQQNQRAMGQFACKMQQASVQYSLQKLNFLIGSLLKAVQKTKTQVIKAKPYSFIGEDLQLNLVTCKIGDLLRCKFSSKQEEVIRVFQFLITMSQMSYFNLFKIIRIKNRLHHSTRDILINALFKNQIVCQIQLAINQNSNKKQKYMDKFNHFLYEIKRAQMGAMLEICNIWVNNCPKSETFRKAILSENERKRKTRQNICSHAIFQFIQNKHKFQKLPFICKLCKIFYPGQKMIFNSFLFDQYKDPICGECLSTRVQKAQRLKYFFATQDKPTQIANYMVKFRIHEAVLQIFTFQEIKKHNFMIMLPTYSKKINKFGIRRIDTNQITFLVQNILTDDGKMEIKVKYQFDITKNIAQQQKRFFSKHCLFTFSRPSYLKRASISKNNFNGLLQKDFKKIQTYQIVNKNQLECLYMQFGEQQILFPHYNDPTINLVQKLKNDNNMFKIIQSIKDSKQVLQLSNLQLKEQLHSIPAGIKIKINTIVKELYLDDNLMQNISFVTQIQYLAILTAKHNSIREIPQMPQNIEIIDLTGNLIQRISGLSQRSYQYLRVIKLCVNNIRKIQNLQNTPNLRQLSLYRNKVSRIQGLDLLVKLTRLNLSYNPIQVVQNLQCLRSIQYLSLGNTQINHINNGMKDLDTLCTLILDSSNMRLGGKQQLPRRVKNLNLSNNNIVQMSALHKLDNIQQLILHDNMIIRIEASQWLQNIKLLNLSRNNIGQIPQMKILSDLKQLYLSHNSIQQIKGLQQNLFLSILDISHNKIKQLKNIKYLVNLTKLSAKNNQIQTLEQFQNLKSLNQIQLANNLITSIITFPQSLKKINLQNNRIESLDWISEMIKKKSSQQDKFQQINLKSNQIPQVMLLLVKSLLHIDNVNILV